MMCGVKIHKTNINFLFLSTLLNLIALRIRTNGTEWGPSMKKIIE